LLEALVVLINNRVKLAVLACVIGGVFLWLTWPTMGQLSVESCTPDTAIAKLSALIHGEGFWRVQLADIRYQRDEAENWDRTQAEKRQRISEILAQTDEVLRRQNEEMAETFRKYPRLAPSPEQQLAYRMQEQAEEMNAQAVAMELAKLESRLSEKMRKKVPVLQRCETLIREKRRWTARLPRRRSRRTGARNLPRRRPPVRAVCSPGSWC
jgi:hypothetical protein